jgi:hypothetical protein
MQRPGYDPNMSRKRVLPSPRSTSRSAHHPAQTNAGVVIIEQTSEDVGDRAQEQPEARGTKQQPLCIGPLEPEATVTEQQTTDVVIEEQGSSALDLSADFLVFHDDDMLIKLEARVKKLKDEGNSLREFTMDDFPDVVFVEANSFTPTLQLHKIPRYIQVSRCHILNFGHSSYNIYAIRNGSPLLNGLLAALGTTSSSILVGSHRSLRNTTDPYSSRRRSLSPIVSRTTASTSSIIQLTTNRNGVVSAVERSESFQIDRTGFSDKSALFSETIAKVKTLFHGDPVCKAYLESLRMIPRMNLDVKPFIFLISPSGSGKTTFCLNLSSRDEFPSLYFTFADVGSTDQVQDIYKCFLGISNLVKAQVDEDLLLLDAIEDLSSISEDDKNNPHFRYQSNSILERMDRFKFRTVGLIVTLFSDLVSRKKSTGQLSFIEVQMLIESVSFAPMTIKDGLDKLRDLTSLDYPDYPLVLFFDETIIKTDRDINRMLLLRSLARCLKVVICFAGTDAKVSNFCAARSNMSGSSGEPVPWAIVFNVMPAYDSGLFASRVAALEPRVSRNHNVQIIIDYLQCVYKSESPWFVDLCLDFLGDTEVDSDLDGIDLFRKMIRFASEMFIARKNPRTSFKEYDDAQRWYITNHSWNTTLTESNGLVKVIKSRVLPESNIHRHMGYLFGFPDSPNGPYFTLYNFGGKVVCISAKQYDQEPMKYRQRFNFKPESVFPSFSHASLTGLVLFGIDLHHIWMFDEDSGNNSTSCYYVTQVVNSITVPNPTGLTLETLTHLAMIQASKTGGIFGCSVPDFLQSLVREFTPCRSISDQELMPVIHFEVDPCPEYTIPLLSPMAFTSWSAPLFDCLQSLMGPQSSIWLGTYQQTLNKDPADGVAFYQTSAQGTVEISISPEESLKILRNSVIRGTREIKVHAPKYSKCFGVQTGGDLSNIAFVVECRQWSNRLKVSDICEIVSGKFSKYKLCRLFFIIAIDMNVGILNISGYRSWVLERSTRGERPFTLKRLNSGPAQPEQKCLILIPLKVIWGSDADILEENLKRQMAS